MNIQNKRDREKFARLRQSLLRLAEEIPRLVPSLLSDKPVIRGSVYELKRKCGKPGCKCNKGPLHGRMVLSASEGGRTQLQVIPSGLLVDIRIKVRRYQALRRSRARAGEIHKKMLHIMDQIEALRREDMSSEKGSGTAKRIDPKKRSKKAPKKAEGKGKQS